MEKLKDLWSRFKVQISFVAGCLVVATSFGTCTFDPSQTSDEAPAEEAAAPAVEAVPTSESASSSVSTTETTTLEAPVTSDETSTEE